LGSKLEINNVAEYKFEEVFEKVLLIVVCMYTIYVYKKWRALLRSKATSVK